MTKSGQRQNLWGDRHAKDHTSTGAIADAAEGDCSRRRMPILHSEQRSMLATAHLSARATTRAEAATKRALVYGVRRVLVVADSTKIGQEPMVQFAGLRNIDMYVTHVGVAVA